MLHVDAKKEDAMTGGQCGFYIRKYVELYRVVVLSELKLWNADLENELAEAINGYMHFTELSGRHSVLQC